MEANILRDAWLPEEAAGFDRPAPACAAPLVRPARTRLAYLTNVYPKISHSFIQTEIAGLERAGLTIDRFTIRRSAQAPSDAEEEAEAARTTALLDGNLRGLAVAVLERLATRPRATLGALVQALRRHGGWGGGHDGVVRALAYFVEAAALARGMEARGIRHVHVHFGTNSVAVARLATKMAVIGYSFTVHGPDEFDAPQRLDLKGKITDAAFVAGVSHYGRGQLLRWADPASWNKVHVVRCAVARAFLSQAPAPTAGLSSRFVCVARLSAQKGLPLLIEAAALMPRDRAFTIDIIGDGEDRAKIKAQIARLGLGARVRLLGWRAPAQVHEALGQARAFVLPSFAEGLPVVLMEALGVGRPVIATAVAGIPELVNADTGWLVPCGSAKALSHAMAAALDAAPEELDAMGRAGRARVAAMHDPDVNARRLAGLLRPLL